MCQGPRLPLHLVPACLQPGRFGDIALFCGSSIRYVCTTLKYSFMCSSNSGVVNIYENSAKPIRTVMSLTTQISSLSFNHDSQILAMASTETRNGLRLVRLTSCLRMSPAKHCCSCVCWCRFTSRREPCSPTGPRTDERVSAPCCQRTSVLTVASWPSPARLVACSCTVSTITIRRRRRRLFSNTPITSTAVLHVIVANFISFSTANSTERFRFVHSVFFIK